MKTIFSFIFVSLISLGFIQSQVDAQRAAPDRTILPIKEPTYPAQTELDARKSKAPARFDLKAPKKAPNVVIVLIDDFGFGQSGAFGGPINMPNLDRMAAT